MISKIFNYGIRIIIILLGISFLSGIFNPLPEMYDESVIRVFGVVFILFGIYRLVSYRSSEKRFMGGRRYTYGNEDEGDDDE